MSEVNVNLKGKPFYDDYDLTKNYTKVIALPGRVEQAREFTQVQTMLLDFLKRLGDVSLKDGSIIEGCELNITGTTCQISAGKVYLNGIVRSVPESKVNITGVGNEVIGVKLKQSLITEADDKTLCDPAEGYDNYGQPGAYRLQETVVVTSNDSESATIYRLVDGSLLLNEVRPELDIIADVLARRTYDEMGNYKVSGLTIIDKKEHKDDAIKIAVESGQCYIKGYNINKPSATNTWIPKAQATRKVIAEPKIFHTGTKQYALNNNPVKKIHQLTAVVEVTQNITRGNVVGGSDYLSFNPVVDIVKVSHSGQTYNKGVDFQLSADSIDWSPSGSEPSIGASYSVTWKYNKILKENTDFKLTNKNGIYYIDFTDISTTLPVDQSTFTIDYEFYLGRKDIIALDCHGNTVDIQGEPNVLSLAVPPIYNDREYFRLGVLTLPPNSDEVEILNNAITRMPVEKLHALAERIDDLEYNQAVTNLDKLVLDSEPANTLKGILTDSFVNFSKSDIAHAKWDSAIDLTEKCTTLPFTFKSYPLKVSNPDIQDFKAKISGTAITSKYTETAILTQKYASETVLLNPYKVYAKNAVMRLTPGVSTAVGVVRTIDGGEDDVRKDLTNWNYYHGSNWAEREKQALLDQGWTGVNTSVHDTGYFNGSTTTMTGTMITETPKDRLLTYIPQETINIEVTNAIPYADNLKVTFDGSTVSAIPGDTQYKGTQSGTLKADGAGVIKGSFKIPANVPTGSREVVLLNSSTGDNSIKATANFVAPGKVQDVERVIRRIKVVTKPYDPVAQSFQFEQEQFITSVDLYFAAKDPSANVTVEIRNMVNGMPGTVQLGCAVLTPGQINISENASNSTKVKFPEPIYCEANTQYCIIATSDSPVTSLFVANLGDKDLTTGQFIVRQPYGEGVLFTSSNAITWTPNQTKDLKMVINCAKFETKGTVLFDEVECVANKLMLNTTFLLPRNTTCRWEYKLNGESEWLPLNPLVDVYLAASSSKVQLRANLSGTENVSPLLNIEANSIDTSLNKLKGSYITRNVAMPQKFTSIKQVVDLALPSGAQAVVKYTTETDCDGDEKWKTASQKSVTPVNQSYSRYTFEATVESAANFRARIDFTTSSPCIIPKVKNLMNILK